MALAAVAQGNVWLLIFGLLLSIPLLVFGGLLIVALLRRHPSLVALGGVALGWIAGQIALADPAIAGWAQSEAPALSIVLPVLGAVLVFWESRILLRARRRGKPFRAMKPAVAIAPRPGASDGDAEPDSRDREERMTDNLEDRPVGPLRPSVSLDDFIAWARSRLPVFTRVPGVGLEMISVDWPSCALGEQSLACLFVRFVILQRFLKCLHDESVEGNLVTIRPTCQLLIEVRRHPNLEVNHDSGIVSS